MAGPDTSTYALKADAQESELLRILYTYNPWWTGKPIPDIKLKRFKRYDYQRLADQLDNQKIVAIVGPRQVGKTTLLYQLVQSLLHKTKPQNLMYLSLDDPYLNVTVGRTKQIFDIYSTSIAKRPLDELEETAYFFLDEIQSVHRWEDMLKRWYDLGYRIKFVVSGSSSLSILRGTSEALVGRINPQIVLPMKFTEYIRFREGDSIADAINAANSSMRQALQTAVKAHSPRLFYDSVKAVAKDLAPLKDKILVYLNQYLIKGGYPEIAKIDDTSECTQNLRNYLNLTIYKDIMRTGKVRDPVALESLFAMLAKESSQVVNRFNLAKTLGLKRETLNTYIYLLKSAFLVSEAETYSKSRAKRIRREKKVYVNDVGIRNASCALLDDQTLTIADEMGKVAETVSADHSRRLRLDFDPSYNLQTMYWREKHEVDFIIELFNKPLPVEVKYREQIRGLQGLEDFNSMVKPPLSIVITKDYMDIQEPNVFIPMWQYLTMC